MANNNGDIKSMPGRENGQGEHISVKPVVASDAGAIDVAITENGVLYTVPQVSNGNGEVIGLPQVSADEESSGTVAAPQVSADADGAIINEVEVQKEGTQNEVQIVIPENGSTQNEVSVETELVNNDEGNESEYATFPDAVKKFFDDLIKNEGLQNERIIVKSLSEKGDNFLGRLFRVRIVGTNNDEEKEFKFVVKLSIENEAVRSQLALELFYKREILMYTDVLRIYEDIQANLPDSRKLKFPKCYFTDDKELEECVIMEDLAERGFTIQHRLKHLSYEHASLVMKAIGQFHALSFKVQRDLPKLFEYYVNNTEDIIYSLWTGENELKSREYLQYAFDAAVNVLESKEEKEKLSTFSIYYMDRIVEAMKPTPYSVITHADCWIHNMMFRHEKERPVECILLDYQICRYASPVLDVLNFIFSCTDHRVRKKHFDDLIETYYSSLSDHLSLLSLDVHEVYPRKVFFAHLRKYSAFSLGYSIMLLPTLTRADEQVQDLEEIFESLEQNSVPQVKNSKLFDTRIRDLVGDFISYGYL